MRLAERPCGETRHIDPVTEQKAAILADFGLISNKGIVLLHASNDGG